MKKYNPIKLFLSVLLITFFSIPSNLFAQIPQDLALADEYYEQGEYEKVH